MKVSIINPLIKVQLFGAPPIERIEVNFFRHDRDAEVVRKVPAAQVRKALGTDLFDRLVENAVPTGRYGVEIHGYVWEAVRV